MAVEIERKFLVASDGWRNEAQGSKRLRQAYLARSPDLTIRVRISDEVKAKLTLKGSGALSRDEWEYEIPVEDARELMDRALGRVVAKRRYDVPAGALTWEIDVFEGDHAGLVLAEIELPDETTQFPRPGWLGEEVTGDPRYYNVTLAGVADGADG